MPASPARPLAVPTRLRRVLAARPHLLRYLAVGGACTAFQLVVFHVLRLGVPAGTTAALAAANALAFVASTQVNFVLSYRWTWAQRLAGATDGPRDRWRRWVLFNAAALLGLGVNSAAFWGALHLAGLPPTGSAVAAVAVSTGTSYLVGSRLTFAVPASHLTAHPDPAAAPRTPGTAFFLPAHDEADALPGVVAAVVDHLRSRGEPCAVFVVDDGSTDATPAVAATLAARLPEVSVLTHPRNRGYGAALRTGLAAGLASGLEWVAFCDADGQFDPRDVALLHAAALGRGADLAIGYRTERADALHRRLMGRGWQLVSRAALGYRARDVDCGFKLFRASSLAVWAPALSGDHAAISPELLARAARARQVVAEVGLPHYPRTAGTPSGADPAVVWRSLTGLVGLRRELSREEAA